LAAYANVRKSIEHPDMYVKNNIETTCKLLVQIQKCNIKPLFIYASSSSVYGTNVKTPFQEYDPLLNLESPYALSKKVCEEYVEFFCKIYKLQAIGLRFFTVYGPGGRPDMAIYKFLDKIRKDESIVMYGDGSMERDYTFVLDIIEGIYSCLKVHLKKGEHKIYNLGNNSPVKLNKIISICENVTGKKATIVKMDVPIGDVPITYANIDKAKIELGYNPTTNIENGISEMYKWMQK
jgi:UDP-glucuronate 4-epimerase